MDSSSPLSGDILTCSRPLIERRLRPPHDQSLKCPRCDSAHTKFCYYNNYSLSQPRYFCKTCRRYWTKGGTLRNIPVGGGCRKNKKVSSKKSNINEPHQNAQISSSSATSINNPTDLQLSFPDQMPNFPHHQFTNFNHAGGFGGTFNTLENPTPIHDFMENKYEALVGGTISRNQDFLGNGDTNIGMMNGFGEINGHGNIAQNFHPQGICSSFGIMTMDGNNFMDTSQRLMLPYETHQEEQQNEVKPNPKLLSLEWHDQLSCSEVGKESSFGYIGGGLGSWTGLMNNGYGSSATNPLV